jgi:hypothetical protein
MVKPYHQYDYRSFSMYYDGDALRISKKGSSPIDREEFIRETDNELLIYYEEEYDGIHNAFLFDFHSGDCVFYKTEQSFLDYLDDDNNFIGWGNSVTLKRTENDDRFESMPWNTTSVWTGYMYWKIGKALDDEETRQYIAEKKSRNPSLIPLPVENLLEKAIRAYQTYMNEAKEKREQSKNNKDV